jgi:hypothetical protein
LRRVCATTNAPTTTITARSALLACCNASRHLQRMVLFCGELRTAHPVPQMVMRIPTVTDSSSSGYKKWPSIFTWLSRVWLQNPDKGRTGRCFSKNGYRHRYSRLPRRRRPHETPAKPACTSIIEYLDG